MPAALGTTTSGVVVVVWSLVEVAEPSRGELVGWYVRQSATPLVPADINAIAIATIESFDIELIVPASPLRRS